MVFGVIIGALVAGIALATILPMYIRDRAKNSMNLTLTDETVVFFTNYDASLSD